MGFNKRYGLIGLNARQISSMVFGRRMPIASRPRPKAKDLFKPQVRSILELDHPVWEIGQAGVGLGTLMRNALGSVEEYQNDSVSVIQAKIANAKALLANAKAEREKCNSVSVISIVSGGISNLECTLRWDGQIGWWQDRLNEATAALRIAQARAAAEAAIDAAAEADQIRAADEAERAALTAARNTGGAAKLPISSGGRRPSSSDVAALTSSSSFLSSVPKPILIVGGIAVLGALAFFGTKALKK